MKETYQYHGHSIDLELSGMAQARIRWTYFIDEDYCGQGTMDFASIESVRVTALAIAHKSVDVLDSMRRGNDDPQSAPVTDSRLVSTMMDHGPQRFSMGGAARSEASALASLPAFAASRKASEQARIIE